MKELKVFGIFLAVVLLLLTVLMAALAGNTTQVSRDRETMIQMWKQASWFSVPAQSRSHGEDGPIVWQDPGMEAHIRFLLRQPEGDIYKSQVWDIQVLTIMPNYSTDHDSAMWAPPEGSETFDYQTVIGATRYWEYYEGKTFPPVENLKDLVHFENLQVLCMDLLPEDGALKDLSGLENCRDLKVLQLTNAAPETLEPLASLSGLEYLSLDCCGMLDLSWLSPLSGLRCLSVYGSGVVSLEPVAELPSLSYLDLSGGSRFPSLEPLSRSCVSYLRVSSPADGPNGMDWDVLARIPGLTALDLSEHPAVDTGLCRMVLAGCPGLRYLDIYGTPAAAQADTLETDHLLAFVYS